MGRVRIGVLHANVAVWLSIAVLAVLYGPELRWAAGALPGYLDGSIGAPVERLLYRRAAERIRDDHDLEEARLMLQASIDIDPYSEALYWLGEYRLRAGQDEEALGEYRRYVQIDPTDDTAWRRIVSILDDLGRADEAMETLRRGRETFRRAATLGVPRPDPDVDSRYNEKAVETHAELVEAGRWFEREIARREAS